MSNEVQQGTVNTKQLAQKLKEQQIVGSIPRGMALIRVVLAVIMEEVNKGNRVRLRRFGVFVPRLRRGTVREIQGNTQEIDDRYFVTFKSSVAFKRFLNGESKNPVLEDLET